MRVVLALAAVAALVLAAFLVLERRPQDAIVISAPDPAPAVEPAPAPALERAPDAPDGARSVASAPDESAPQTASAPRAHVFGRVVDEHGAALAEVEVRIAAVDGAWREGVEVPELQSHGHSSPGFRARSDAQGRYAFDVPLPSASWVTLWVEPAAWLGLGGRDFGPAGGRNQPRLVEGENDLGDLVLAITGAVEGDLYGSDGTRLANGRVRLHDAFPGGRGVSTETDAQGHFLLGHLPPGRWTLQAEAEGWLLANAQGVEVRARETTSRVDFRLERAPTLSGSVADERGHPLADVRIWGWPRGGGRGAGTRSRGDGSFTIHLPQPDPYTLEVKQQGFSDWGGFGSDQRWAPGSNDIRIVLHRLARTRFLVVDAASGAPIERYAIGAAEVNAQDPEGRNSSLDVRVEDHAGGACELDAEAGKCAVFVEAAGRVRVSTAVAPDASGTQRIALARGATLRGRVTHAGRALAGAALVLERALCKTDPSQPDVPEDERWFADGYGFDLCAFVGARRSTASASDGSFRFEGLAAGTWKLALSGGGAAPRVLPEIRLAAEEELDLSELELGAGASVRGRVVLAPGQSPVGRELVLDEGSPRQEIRDLDGSFAFAGLAPGKHVLTLRGTQRAQRDERREFDLAAGQTQEIVFDLAARSPCHVRLHLVWLPIAEQPGLRVLARHCEGGQPGQAFEFGTSDALGVVEGDLEGDSDCGFEVLTPAGLLLASHASLHLPPGGSIEPTIEIDAGKLVVELPESFTLPEAGQLTVMLRDADEQRRAPLVALFSTRASPFPTGKLEWKGRRVELGFVPAGRFRVVLNAQRWKRGENGQWMGERLPLDVAESPIEIGAGETATLRAGSAK